MKFSKENEGKILYFPGCEPKDAAPSVPPVPAVPSFVEDPMKEIYDEKKHLESIGKDHRTVVPIFYFPGPTGKSLTVAYRIDCQGGERHSYRIYERRNLDLGQTGFNSANPDVRRVRAMYRYSYAHRLVDFETAFPGLERNRLDIEAFGPAPKAAARG